MLVIAQEVEVDKVRFRELLKPFAEDAEDDVCDLRVRSEEISSLESISSDFDGTPRIGEIS